MFRYHPSSEDKLTHNMLQPGLSHDIKKILNKIPELIKKTFPIPGRFRHSLPSDIAELSRLLTNNRGERHLSYLTRANYLSAYLYYFMPWNIYRLCLLLADIDLRLGADDIITDLGCGPLTFASALWIARPELRGIPLEINCVDKSKPVLEAGKKFFLSLCEAENKINRWRINLIKEDIDIRKGGYVSEQQYKTNSANKTGICKKASLVCAVNFFNEIYENISHNNTEGLRRIAENAARITHNIASDSALILTVEPGVPQSGKFISFLRDSFLELNRPPLSPCTHSASCPMLHGKEIKISANNQKKKQTQKRWCHYAFDTVYAPDELQRLSSAAGLSKERLVFSFLLTGNVSSGSHSSKIRKSDKIRVISDAFPINIHDQHVKNTEKIQKQIKRFGRYGCSEDGLILLSGNKDQIEKINSFSIISSAGKTMQTVDKKSGAYILEME